MVMRLDKLLANYGIGTRKEVKSLIRKGFVKVNGMIIKKDDFKVDHEIDEIEERPTILYGKALLGQWMGVVDEELRICPEYDAE